MQDRPDLKIALLRISVLPCLLTLLLFSTWRASAQQPAQSGLQIRGQVLGPAGNPVAKAKILLTPKLTPRERAELSWNGESYPEAAAEALSGADGRFELLAPQVGMWSVLVRARGFLPVEHPAAPLLDPLDLPVVRLQKTREVKLRLVDSQGKAVESRVLVRGTLSNGRRGNMMHFYQSGWRPTLRLIRTDTAGKATVLAGAKEELSLTATAPNYPTLHQDIGSETNPVLTLKAARPIPVRAVDGQGRPVPGALVCAASAILHLPIARSDEEGRMILTWDQSSRADGSIIILDAEGRMSTHNLEFPKPREDGTIPELKLTLPPSQAFSGRVIDSVHRAPVADALVWVQGVEGIFTRSDRQGVYTFPSFGISAQKHSILSSSMAAAATGYATGRDLSSSTREKTGGPTLVLDPAVSLAGRVLDPDRNPVPDVEIRAILTGGMEAQGFSMSAFFQGQRLYRTGSTGRFYIPRLVAGTTYSLELRKAGFARTVFAVPTLEPGESQGGLEVILDPGYSAIGQVVDEGDLPIPGAELSLVAKTSGRNRNRDMHRLFQREPAEELQAQSDREGIYRFVDLGPGLYDLQARAQGFAPVTVPGVEILADTGPTDLGAIALLPGANIEGRVVDTDGLALAGVVVTSDEAPQTTGADGTFLIPDLKSGDRINLKAQKSGYATASLRGIVAPTNEPLEIVLSLAATVRGLVVDTDREPIAGAQINLRAERQGGSGNYTLGGWSPGITDAEGRFVIDNAEPGRLGLSARAEGYIPYERTGLVVEPGGDLADLEIVLSTGATVEGTVKGPGGKPLAQVFVSLYDPTGGRRFTSGGAVSDGEGNFRITGTETGFAAITARHGVHGQVSRELEISPGDNEIDLTFEGGFRVSGRILGPEGQPLAGATLRLRGERTRGLHARSDGEGSFRFESVDEGTYTLIGEHPDHAQGQQEGIQVSDTDISGLELRLDGGASIRGRVLGVAFDDLAELAIQATGSGGRSTGTVDFEGSYHIDNLAPSDYFVTARLPGSGRQVTEKITVEVGAREVALDLDFGQGLTLSGRILHGRSPVTGANVQASGLNVARRGETTSDQEGSFRIENLERGRYRVTVQDFNTGLHHSEEVELETDQEVELRLETATVSGRLIDGSDFGPVSGARLQLERDGHSTGGFGFRDTRSDSEGRFSLGEVGEGQWRLLATKSGYVSAEIDLDVRSGQTIDDLELTMTPNEGITFQAFGADGRPLAQLRIAFYAASGAFVSSQSHRAVEAGRFRISTLPPGSFIMLLSDSNHAVLSTRANSPGDLGQLRLGLGGALSATVPELADGETPARLTMKNGNGIFRLPTWGGSVASEWPLSAGHARVTHIPAGTWQVNVQANDGRTWSTTVQVIAGRETSASLR